MSWIYRIITGELFDPTGKLTGMGYSGRAEGRNNVEMQVARGVGPIPVGRYLIGQAYRHELLGPLTMNLDPIEGTDTLGRDLFRIHGDNSVHDASHGCVIMIRPVREAVAASSDRTLEVVA